MLKKLKQPKNETISYIIQTYKRVTISKLINYLNISTKDNGIIMLKLQTDVKVNKSSYKDSRQVVVVIRTSIKDSNTDISCNGE